MYLFKVKVLRKWFGHSSRSFKITADTALQASEKAEKFYADMMKCKKDDVIVIDVELLGDD